MFNCFARAKRDALMDLQEDIGLLISGRGLLFFQVRPVNFSL